MIHLPLRSTDSILAPFPLLMMIDESVPVCNNDSSKTLIPLKTRPVNAGRNPRAMVSTSGSSGIIMITSSEKIECVRWTLAHFTHSFGHLFFNRSCSLGYTNNIVIGPTINEFVDRINASFGGNSVTDESEFGFLVVH